MIFWKYYLMHICQIYPFCTRLILLTLQVFCMPVAGHDNLPMCIFRAVTTGCPLLLWMSSQYLTSSHHGISVGSPCCNWVAVEDSKFTDSCLQRISNTSGEHCTAPSYHICWCARHVLPSHVLTWILSCLGVQCFRSLVATRVRKAATE